MIAFHDFALGNISCDCRIQEYALCLKLSETVEVTVFLNLMLYAQYIVKDAVYLAQQQGFVVLDLCC